MCSLLGMIYYYASLQYVSSNVQKCSYSFIIYFTGAIFASKVFDNLDSIFHPAMTNIVTTMRASHLQTTASIER